MALTRFKTNRRWWFWMSLALFVVPWFLPIWRVKGDVMMPASVWIYLFTYPDHFGETLTFIGMFTLLFGMPAILMGWVLHCVVVMISDAKKRK